MCMEVVTLQAIGGYNRCEVYGHTICIGCLLFVHIFNENVSIIYFQLLTYYTKALSVYSTSLAVCRII